MYQKEKKWPTSVNTSFFWKGHILFCKRTHSDSKNKIYIWKLTSSKCSSFWLTVDFFMHGRRVCQHSRHSKGFQLCSSQRWLVSWNVGRRLHTETYQERRKKASPVLYATLRCPFTSQVSLVIMFIASCNKGYNRYS